MFRILLYIWIHHRSWCNKLHRPSSRLNPWKFQCPFVEYVLKNLDGVEHIGIEKDSEIKLRITLILFKTLFFVRPSLLPGMFKKIFYVWRQKNKMRFARV